MLQKNEIPITQIVKGCKKGNRKSQQAFYETIGPGVMGVCLRYIRDRNFVEDTFQDIMLKLLTQIDKFKQGDVHAWAKRVAVNHCLDYLKKSKKEQIFIEYIDESKVKIDNERDDEDFSKEDLSSIRVDQLRSHIDALPEQQRLVVQMHIVDNIRHKAIGEILGISENASKSLLKRAKKRLLEAIHIEKKKVSSYAE